MSEANEESSEKAVDPLVKREATNDEHGGNVESPSSSESPTTEPWRQVIGRGMEALSDTINDNIVAVRYATIASICLVSAYGVSRTPLFFRFKTVKDIPSSYFLQRRRIHGRLVRVIENTEPVKGKCTIEMPAGDVEQPIVCLVRNLSPIGRLLNRSAFDFIMKSHPTAMVQESSQEDIHELLKVEIAGAKEAPPYNAPRYDEQPGEWLRCLADEKAPVSCQLLARRSLIEGAPKRNAAALAEFQQTVGEDQIAVCHVRYRPSGHLLRRDLAYSLVRHGRASIASSAFVSMKDWRILDASERVEDLKKDTKYMHQLEEAEYEAAKESLGMWADPVVRDSRQDLVEEISFQREANIFQKAWRWLRG